MARQEHGSHMALIGRRVADDAGMPMCRLLMLPMVAPTNVRHQPKALGAKVDVRARIVRKKAVSVYCNCRLVA